MLLYLGLYTWNRRTGVINQFAANIGIPFVGYILLPVASVERYLQSVWDDYVYLVNVEEENKILRSRILELEKNAVVAKEVMAENVRLQKLLTMTPMPKFTQKVARVLATRYGAQAVVETFLIDKGTLDGIAVDSPVIIPQGLVGRVVRVAPTHAVVLSVTAPESRVAVITQDTRVVGILSGMGMRKLATVLYVPRSENIHKDSLLVTSGMDGLFPKGVPVATVENFTAKELFYDIQALFTASLQNLEEVVVLLPVSHTNSEGLKLLNTGK